MDLFEKHLQNAGSANMEYKIRNLSGSELDVISQKAAAMGQSVEQYLRNSAMPTNPMQLDVAQKAVSSRSRDFGAGAGTLTLNIFRNTANINRPLPVVLGFPWELKNGYNSLISDPAFQGVYGGAVQDGRPSTETATVFGNPVGQLPANSVFAGNGGDPDGINFFYSEGGSGDTIRVSCQDVPYPVLLQSLIGNFISYNSVKMRVPVANLDQFLQNIEPTKRSILGKFTSNRFVPDTYVSVNQQVVNLVQMPIRFVFNANHGIIMLVNAVAQEIGITFSVDAVSEPVGS